MATLLEKELDQLAAFEPTTLPVISLYLDTQSDQHGREAFTPFLKKELRGRAKTFEPRSPARLSFDLDVERIEKYLTENLRPSTNGVALFACAGADEFFVPVQLNAPLGASEIYVGAQPHLYTLARVNDQYPLYAVVLADTNSARLFVFALGSTVDKDQVQSTKMSQTQAGGWSQARYQRHVENYHLQHAKEVLDTLGQVVREEGIQHIVFAGDEVVIPILQKQLTPFLASKVVDVLRLEMTTPEHRILEATLAAMRVQDAKDDAEKVERLIGDYRAGGLAVVGVQDVLKALANGQVDEVLLSASSDQIDGADEAVAALAPDVPGETPAARVSDALVTQARQTAARISFIEDPALLADVGGVGALLRYKT